MDLLANPAHPYTQLLVSAVPDPARAGSYDPVRTGRAARRRSWRPPPARSTATPTSPAQPTEPVRHQVGDPANRHWVRCHLYRPRAGAGGHALADTTPTGTTTCRRGSPPAEKQTVTEPRPAPHGHPLPDALHATAPSIQPLTFLFHERVNPSVLAGPIHHQIQAKGAPPCAAPVCPSCR